jgi:hypothetical protein
MAGRVTADDNDDLTKEFTIEEFKAAVFSMHSDKPLDRMG